MDFIIREMLLEDISNVTNMMCDVFDKEKIFLDYRHELIKESLHLAFVSKTMRYNAKYFIAEIKDEIIGVGGVKESFISDNVFELCWMTVKHEYQGHGIGTALILKRIEYAKEVSGYDVRILTGTRVPKMFKRLGFVEFMESETDGDYLALKYSDKNIKKINTNIELSNEKFKLQSIDNDPILFFQKDENGEVRIQIDPKDGNIVDTWIKNEQLEELINFLKKQINK